MAVQIRPEQERRLEHLATEAGISPEELLQRQLDAFLNDEEEVARLMKRADEDIAAGRILTHAEVLARVEKLLRNE